MEKQILFNTEMVKAILEGRKTQTRRAIKNIRAYHMDGTPGNMPPWKPGDVLYVRETWAWMNAMDCGSPCLGPCNQYKGEYGCLIYKATKTIFTDGWNPSIHMPREAARLFLKVKDVRIEHLQDCGRGWCLDIEKEGVRTPQDPILYVSDDKYHDALRAEMEKVWGSTLKPVEIDRFGWAANPWVGVIECEKMEGWP